MASIVDRPSRERKRKWPSIGNELSKTSVPAAGARTAVTAVSRPVYRGLVSSRASRDAADDPSTTSNPYALENRGNAWTRSPPKPGSYPKFEIRTAYCKHRQPVGPTRELFLIGRKYAGFLNYVPCQEKNKMVEKNCIFYFIFVYEHRVCRWTVSIPHF